MVYQRKTTDEFHVQANYGYGDGWESVVVEETYKAAKEQKKCYMENDPRAYKIVTKRVPINKEA